MKSAGTWDMAEDATALDLRLEPQVLSVAFVVAGLQHVRSIGSPGAIIVDLERPTRPLSLFGRAPC